MLKTELIRKYIEPKKEGVPQSATTILTDVQVGRGDITLTLSPEQQAFVLRSIANASMFARVEGMDDLPDPLIRLVIQMEYEIEQSVGLDTHELPGEPYER